MFLTHKAVPATALVLLLGAATAVQAGNNYGTNRKVMSGAQCQPSDGAQWPDIDINPDGIRNMSDTYARYISCTIPMDSDTTIDQSDFDSTTTQGAFTFEVGMDYSATPSAGLVNTTCTMYRRSGSTGVKTSEAFTITSAKTTDPVTYSVTPDLMDGASALVPDVFSFNCKLNPKIKLAYIKWYEAENTGGYYYTP
ncbi:hypothetical protein MQC88_12070 [Luteimonas sp. 50]|uniref:Ig-like domain-containing protein n=1 Tax=Cognatiluteimonas sedimenti TaxID=2927791 RepID=A0ABT0A6T8_9GAMM|nr:hypothetical protein [Lysobacter sedimenti]MCJ0826679.1 hypothetical protein [Lysobacter sedimenti]